MPAARPGAALTIRDDSATAKTLVRSDRAQFGLSFGSSARVEAALVAATRPDEWLILGDDDAVKAASAQIDRGGFTSVIPFTHGRALFTITGDNATAMLEKVCGIDWSDTMTPNGAVVSASVALVTCDIVRHDVGGAEAGLEAGQGTPSYLLICDRSFGQYLFDALLDAGTEFDIGTATP